MKNRGRKKMRKKSEKSTQEEPALASEREAQSYLRSVGTRRHDRKEGHARKSKDKQVRVSERMPGHH